MTDASLSPHEADDAEAAEYVLGVQSPIERQSTEARIKRDAGFAALVSAWEKRMEGLNDEYAPGPAPNVVPKAAARMFPDGRPAIRRFSLARWLSGALLAAVVVLAALVVLTPPRSDLVAVLATADDRLVYEVRHDAGRLQVTRVAGVPAVAGQVHELWIFAPDATPVSLGLIPGRMLSVDYPRPPAGWTLAVSIERAGGSPTGQPTGPVIMSTVIGS